MNARRSAALLLALAVSVVYGCSGQIIASACKPLSCTLDCEHGLLEDADGCPVCACAPAPGCEPVTCELYCEWGFALGPDGCAVCECAPSPCTTPSPVGCVQAGCPSDAYCDTTLGCHPSACTCDGSGAWSCTKDCLGGTCVPAGGCGPNPAGCVVTGCPDGQVCDTALGCSSSGCACDAATGAWTCLPDCGGGLCVPDPAGCAEPDPTGCKLTGCPLGAACIPTSGVCVPTWCTCDAATGTWTCSMDCDGGVCASM